METILLLAMPGGWEWLVLLLITITIGILWLWAIIDLLLSKFKDSTTKLIWALLIIFVPALGPLLYLIIGRRQKNTS